MEGARVVKSPKRLGLFGYWWLWYSLSAGHRKYKSDLARALYLNSRGSDRSSYETSIQHTRAYGYAVLITTSGILLAFGTLYLMRCYGWG